MSCRHGVKRFDRISWTPNPDGSMRQPWEFSIDGGQTWRNNCDGTYRRKVSAKYFLHRAAGLAPKRGGPTTPRSTSNRAGSQRGPRKDVVY